MRRTFFRKQDYMTFNAVKNKSRCLLCPRELSGYLGSNIRRHYEKLHGYKFENMMGYPPTDEYKQETFVEEPPAATEVTTKAAAKKTTTTTKCSNLKLSKDEFLKCCVGLITVNHLPLRIFDDNDYFKRIINLYEKEFALSLSSKNILSTVDMWAERIKSSLKAKFAQKLICLQIDVASRMKSNVMTLSVHCIGRYDIVTYTIGTVQLKSSHSTQYLTSEIVKCLQEFDIDLKQLYCIIGDNRGHLSKALQQLQQEIEDTRYQNAMESEEMEEFCDDFKSLPSLLDSGYHTIQLIVRTYFAIIDTTLTDIRQTVQMIRQNYVITEDMPSLDNALRWESTYDMVCTMKKYFAANEMDFKVEWITVEASIEAMTPMVDFCKQLKNDQYIVGDFYRDWLLCEAKLKKLKNNEHANKLLQVMSDSKQIMLHNEAFNAALYFDPRFNYKDSPFFSEARKQLAKNYIIKIGVCLNSKKSKSNGPSSCISSSDEFVMDNNTNPKDPYNILEEELQQISHNSSTTQQNLSFRQKLDNLSYNQRMPFSTNVLNYWKDRPEKDNDIHNALKVVLAVPISQSTIERVQSALKTVLTKKKSNLTQENLKNILLIKLNVSLLTHFNA